MMFFLWGLGVTTFLGTAVNAILGIFLVVVGIILHRFEGAAGGGFVTGP